MMRAFILAAAVALAPTGPAQAVEELSAAECYELKTLAHWYGRNTIAARSNLSSLLDQQSEEYRKKVGTGNNYKNPGLEQRIDNTKKSLRGGRAAAVEYSTIWRNLCKD